MVSLESLKRKLSLSSQMCPVPSTHGVNLFYSGLADFGQHTKKAKELPECNSQLTATNCCQRCVSNPTAFEIIGIRESAKGVVLGEGGGVLFADLLSFATCH